jgi:transposase
MLRLAALVAEARMTVAVRTGQGAGELRALAQAAATPEQARRLLAIALVLEGSSRAAAARSTGMDRQTLRDWVHRCNAAGPSGLIDRKAPGRQRRLDPERQRELARCLENGPELAQDGVVRWRLIDLCALSAVLTSRRGIGQGPLVERRFGVRYQERGMGQLVRALGFSRVSARPQHPRSDPEAQTEFKKNWPTGSLPPSATRVRANGSSSGSRTKAGAARRAI